MTSRTIGVAIAIPEPYGSALQRVRESFGDLQARAIPSHITLLPPTEVADLDAIDTHLRAIADSEVAFEIHLRGSGTFSPISPVVFVSVVEGISSCERLESRVRSGPLSRPLAFPYHPHVTMAHHLPDEVLSRAFDELAPYDVRFLVEGFSRYQHGSDEVWRPQRDYPLGVASRSPGERPEA